MKFLALFCVILFACGSTADSLNDLAAIEKLVSNEIGHENYALAEIILQILDRFRGVINDAVKELLENQRHLILTGIPPNFRPLDPLYIEEYLIEPEEVVPGFSNFQMRLYNTSLKGFYNFKIEQVDIRPFGLFGMITISVDKLEMEGFHSTRATLLGQIFPITVEGDGPFSMTLNNFRASVFVEIEFNGRIRPNLKNVVTTYLTTSVQTNFTGFNPVTESIFNIAAQAAFPALIGLSNINANLWLNDEFVPAVNGVINDFGLMDIIGLIRTIIRNNADSFDTEVMDALYRFDQMNRNL
ncbi:uncharacterized protein [Chironomus tepperi]|uniref:uncharacterized protein n=1 Tax=Chironomus tepperi TaxID=113505 RepID=UPI00391F7554